MGSEDVSIFETVLYALGEQHKHPERFGGGLIGKAGAVVRALGVDGDLPVSAIREKGATDG